MPDWCMSLMYVFYFNHKLEETSHLFQIPQQFWHQHRTSGCGLMASIPHSEGL